MHLHARDQLVLGLFGGQARGSFEDLQPLRVEPPQCLGALLEPGLAIAERPGSLLQVAGLVSEPLLPLGDPVLAALDVESLLTNVVPESSNFALGLVSQRDRMCGRLVGGAADLVGLLLCAGPQPVGLGPHRVQVGAGGLRLDGPC